MSMNSFSAVILAAGQGTRMHSKRPKVLHLLAGKPMVEHVIDVVVKLNCDNIHLVYGYGGDHLKEKLAGRSVNWVFQAQQLGTGHAVQQASSSLNDNENILILYADTPLISAKTLTELIHAKPEHGIGLLTTVLADPTGYGRILRENGQVIGIVEHKDASEDQLKINEVNTGILVANGKDLKRWLSMLTNNNKQGEFYLTDIIALAHQDNYKIATIHPTQQHEVDGVNNQLQLAKLERIYQENQAEKLLLAGVMLLDPARFDLRGELVYGSDIVIDANVILEGKVTLGNNVKIGVGCLLKNCTIGDNSEISPYSIIEGGELGIACTVGPFARLRPGVELANKVHVGNFVEMKKTRLGEGSKAGHLSYLGDADIGAGVNIGAGTITCNYDGVNKHQTIIENDVFVGSDTQFVAPVRIAKGSTIAAGTTVTRNVNENELVISRVKQRTITNWQRPIKKQR